MRERPVLFSAPMVRALLAGTKTQTRRVVKGRALRWLDESGFTPDFTAHPENGLCPYGQPGDRLWVRETWGEPWHHAQSRCFYRATDDGSVGNHPDFDGWRPSIHMPRWASRITLEITSVRVERLQDISYDDAHDEGTATWAAETQRDGNKWPNIVRAYQGLWESINGPGSWQANPWVWVIEFRRLPGEGE